MRHDSLPFTIARVRDQRDLQNAVRIRHAAYQRHVPELAQTLATPEPLDLAPGVWVLLAEAKHDRSPLGTMRIQTNGFAPLALERSLELPEWLRTRRLAEATRLGVVQGRLGTQVKHALFKAFFLLCRELHVEWMVVAGRSPIDRQYERLLFQDVYPGLGYVPLRHAGDLPHRVMMFETDSAYARWLAADHPLLDFVFHIVHDDIDLSEGQTA